MKKGVNIELTTDTLSLSEEALLNITPEEAGQLNQIARNIVDRARAAKAEKE